MAADYGHACSSHLVPQYAVLTFGKSSIPPYTSIHKHRIGKDIPIVMCNEEEHLERCDVMAGAG
jgi:hypothetical protein